MSRQKSNRIEGTTEENDSSPNGASPSDNRESTGENEAASMLTKEALGNFITQSPFSFKNPIFFSVPTRDLHGKASNAHNLLN